MSHRPIARGGFREQLRHPSEGRPVALSGFKSLDFDALWRGRDRTTDVERKLLSSILGARRFRRILEVGTGEGRISGAVQEHAEEYFGLDLMPQFVARVPKEDRARLIRAAGNVYRLPFADGSFDAAVMVRLYNFLVDPEAGLRELGRVLRPGGLLVLTYHPTPSVATLVDDLKVSLAPNGGPAFRSMTFSRSESVTVRPSEPPTWAPRRREFRRILEVAGFALDREFPCGLEDYRGLRRLPARLFVALARVWNGAGPFPVRFVAARRASLGPDRPPNSRSV